MKATQDEPACPARELAPDLVENPSSEAGIDDRGGVRACRVSPVRLTVTKGRNILTTTYIT